MSALPLVSNRAEGASEFQESLKNEESEDGIRRAWPVSQVRTDD